MNYNIIIHQVYNFNNANNSKIRKITCKGIKTCYINDNARF